MRQSSDEKERSGIKEEDESEEESEGKTRVTEEE